MKLPVSSPLPFVLAVAITLKPSTGFTHSLIFLRKIPLPSKTGCKHIILVEAKSTSSNRRTPPDFMASTTGPSNHTVSPFTRRKPPSKSSSSVSIVMFTRYISLLSLAQACSTINVLPLPERPVTKTG